MASRALIGSVFVRSTIQTGGLKMLTLAFIPGQPLFALQLYHAATVQGATCLFAGIACILAPIPFVFKRKGPELRRRSKFAA